MTRTLIIMRHAKSSWGDPTQADIDRPLNGRGRASARAIGEWLSFGGFKPDLVLSSNAKRTAETWANMALSADIRFLPELYLAPPNVLLRTVQQAEGDCVLLLAHNPGIAEFAEQIVSDPPRHDRFHDYPTAATLVATFDTPWSEVSWGFGRARAFTVPRDLI